LYSFLIDFFLILHCIGLLAKRGLQFTLCGPCTEMATLPIFPNAALGRSVGLAVWAALPTTAFSEAIRFCKTNLESRKHERDGG
jgi:hypothetical protein